VETTPELLRAKDQRWEIWTKRAEAVTLLVREHG